MFKSKSVTALHRDNYENIYCQVIGNKHFVLMPPIAAPCVNEWILPCATFESRVQQRSHEVSHKLFVSCFMHWHLSGAGREGSIITPPIVVFFGVVPLSALIINASPPLPVGRSWCVSPVILSKRFLGITTYWRTLACRHTDGPQVSMEGNGF